MTRRSRKASCQSSSDSEYSEREGTEDCGSDTDLTEPEDEAYQPCNAGDASLLFADNEYTAEYYIQQLQNFDETVYTQEDYGKGTTALLNRIEEKWSQFCCFIRKDPNEEYNRLSIPILYNFLEWALNLRRGKNGRRLPGIKCKSSLDTFWKVFRLVYERSTSKKIGNQMNRRMRRVIRRLAKKYKLSIAGRDKPPMDVEDLAKVVETTVSTTKKKFGHGRHRIELGLFLQLATQMTLDMINNNMNNNNPTLHPQQRRMIDLFMVLYGTFKWNDVAAKTRVRDRAIRVNQMAAIFASGLIQNTAIWNFICDESEWVLDPNVPSHIKKEYWMINALPAGPRSQKNSTSLCTIPKGFAAGYGGGQAEAVTLTAAHTPGQPSWMAFCAGVWSVLQFQTKVWFQPAKKAAVVQNGDFLYHMIHNTPERLLAHEFTHGHTQFGAYRATDIAYGWGEIVALAIKDNAQTDATQSLAVINADTFTYWINGVYLEMCNFRSGRCEDPDQAAKTP